MEIEHQPVLLEAVVEYISPLSTGATICDATLGAGGLTARLLELFPSCTILGIDADSSMIERARTRIGSDPRLSIVHGWFDEVLSTATAFDRILMDFGISMVHLREGSRGFSFHEDGPLDMRLNRSENRESAADLIRRLTERELADVIYRYGEERYSRRIARAIVEDRAEAASGTKALAEIVKRTVPPKYRFSRIHPATRTFQALRIAVNDELGRIERALPRAARALKPGGRLLAISFHSLEDRIVKHAFRTLASDSNEGAERPMVKEGERFVVLTKKPIVAGDEERKRNSAARSAKLRVLEKGST